MLTGDIASRIRYLMNIPGAKWYWDWRKMYDEMGKSIDAVVVATADHSHAVVAATAMSMGKHAYVQKPLTHSVYESRLLTKLAAKHKVATQMGNQGSSDEGVNLTIEWMQNGEIGDVRKVETFTDRPIWPQGLNRPAKGEWVIRINLTGICLSVQPLCAHITAFILHGTGEAGGISEQELSVIWLAILCILCSKALKLQVPC